jgi:hypothetical protein
MPKHVSSNTTSAAMGTGHSLQHLAAWTLQGLSDHLHQHVCALLILFCCYC